LFVDEVFSAVSQWKQIADAHQVEPRIASEYSKAIQSGPCYADLA